MDGKGDPIESFLRSLFDFSFTSFITSKIIRFLYGFFVFLAGLGAFALIVIGFSDSGGVGILMLFLAPIGFLLAVVVARIYLEILIVVFRISEHVAEIAEQGRKSDSSVSGE